MRTVRFFCLFLFLAGYVSAEEPRHKSELGFDAEMPIQVTFTLTEMKTCTLNSDCIPVPGGVCGCGMGGADMAMNKKYAVVWYKYRADAFKGLSCAAVLSTHWTCKAHPVCEQNQCTLK